MFIDPINRLLLSWWKPRWMNKFSPGGDCTCCGGSTGGCDILNDAFNRANNTNLGIDYDELSGAAAIVSNEVQLTSASTVVRGVNVSPFGPEMMITLKFKLSATSAKLRLYIGDPSSTDYLYGEFGNGKIIIGKEGEVETYANRTFTAGTWYTAQLCWNGSILIGQVNSNQVVSTAYTAPPNDYYGFGCVTATVTVDDLLVQRVSAGCSACSTVLGTTNCGACGGTSPTRFRLHNEWYLIAAGISNSGCSDCSSVDGMYIVPIDFTGGSGCSGRIQFSDGSPCLPDQVLPFHQPQWAIDFTVAFTSPTAANVKVGIGASAGAAGGGASGGVWRHDFTTSTSGLDCDAIDGTVLTFSIPDSPSNPACHNGTWTIGRYYA